MKRIKPDLKKLPGYLRQHWGLVVFVLVGGFYVNFLFWLLEYVRLRNTTIDIDLIQLSLWGVGVFSLYSLFSVYDKMRGPVKIFCMLNFVTSVTGSILTALVGSIFGFIGVFILGILPFIGLFHPVSRYLLRIQNSLEL